MKIILFEDKPKDAARIAAAITKEIPKTGRVVKFEPAASNATSLYDDRLTLELAKPKYAGASIWVSDRDLSQTQGYQGLSETNVTKVADVQGIPLCKYAQGTTDAVFERQRDWGDAQIVLDVSDVPAMARKVAILAAGFDSISRDLTSAMKTSSKRPATPSAVMARILGRPDMADKIALYASGDQKMIAEIMPFATKPNSSAAFKKRLPSLLGYWLYDSILRFPGVIVNEIAASSYLNIAVDDFGKPSIQKLFVKALYGGPFADTAEPHWWRADLDTMIEDAGVKDGIEFVRKKAKKKVAPCLDHQKRAGWYCMVTKKPVSEENSVGNISWFPPGADLARVSKAIYEKAGPWLGLY